MKDGQSTTTSNNDGCGVVEANESSNNNGASAVEADESGWAVDADENDSDDGDGLGPPAAAKNDGGWVRKVSNSNVHFTVVKI
jgi:hypothetical protein